MRSRRNVHYFLYDIQPMRIALLACSLMLIIPLCSILHPFSFLDRYWMSSLEILPEDKFGFSAETTSFTLAENDSGAEAVRMNWLENSLREKQVCERGYELTARTPVLVRQTLTGPVHTVYYMGKCKEDGDSEAK